VIELGREASSHWDPEIGEVAVDALLANPKRLPIHFWDPPFFFSDAHLEAPVDPNDLRVLKRHGIGVIAVPMAIDQRGHRAGTRERIRAAQAAGRLEVRTNCHATELIFDDLDPLRVAGVRYLPGPRLYRADRDPSRLGQPTGPVQEVLARREVIISAGAYMTPQLLMLSVSAREKSWSARKSISIRASIFSGSVGTCKTDTLRCASEEAICSD
jgi:choline dehydrogenase-like flavoprotein